MKKKKSTPTATVTSADAAEAGPSNAGAGGGGGAGVVSVDDTTTESSTPPDNSDERELPEGPVPRAKMPGKRQQDKSNYQGRLLDILERDLNQNQVNTNVSEEDPIDLQMMSMAKRIKKELPVQQQFPVILKLQLALQENIETNSRQNLFGQMALSAPRAPPPPPPPPMQAAPPMQADPARSMLQELNGELYTERTFNFSQL